MQWDWDIIRTLLYALVAPVNYEKIKSDHRPLRVMRYFYSTIISVVVLYSV